MSIAFDNKNSLAGRTAPRIPGLSPHPEWADLRARMQAAREIARLLADEAAADHANNRGSFAQDAAYRLATYGHGERFDMQDVNPTASITGKPDETIRDHTAGTRSTGGRG